MYNPDNFQTALEFFDNNELEEAHPYFEKAAAQGHPAASLYILLFYIGYDNALKSEQGKRCLTTVSRNIKWFQDQAYNTKSIQAPIWLSYCHLYGLGVPENSLEADKCLKLSADRGYVNAQFTLAKSYYAEKKYSEAKKYFQLASKNGDIIAPFFLKNWDFPDATELNKKGVQAFTAKKYDEAKCLYEQAIQCDNSIKEIWLNLAFCHNNLGNTSSAINALDKAISLDARYLKAIYKKVEILSQKKDRKLAEKTIKNYRYANSNNPDLLEIELKNAAKSKVWAQWILGICYRNNPEAEKSEQKTKARPNKKAPNTNTTIQDPDLKPAITTQQSESIKLIFTSIDKLLEKTFSQTSSLTDYLKNQLKEYQSAQFLWNDIFHAVSQIFPQTALNEWICPIITGVYIADRTKCECSFQPDECLEYIFDTIYECYLFSTTHSAADLFILIDQVVNQIFPANELNGNITKEIKSEFFAHKKISGLLFWTPYKQENDRQKKPAMDGDQTISNPGIK